MSTPDTTSDTTSDTMSDTVRHAAPTRLAARTAHLVVRLALLALLAVVTGVLVVLIVLPRVTDGAALTVLTGSMEPGIPTGSTVLVRPVDPGALQVGDVATYQKAPGEDTYITHRIVDLDRSTNPPAYVFQGDANRGPDLKPVPPGAIRGEVWFHVPHLGALKNRLNGSAGLGLLAMLLLGGYALAQLGGAWRDRRRNPGSDPGERATGEPATDAQPGACARHPGAPCARVTSAPRSPEPRRSRSPSVSAAAATRWPHGPTGS